MCLEMRISRKNFPPRDPHNPVLHPLRDESEDEEDELIWRRPLRFLWHFDSSLLLLLLLLLDVELPDGSKGSQYLDGTELQLVLLLLLQDELDDEDEDEGSEQLLEEDEQSLDEDEQLSLLLHEFFFLRRHLFFFFLDLHRFLPPFDLIPSMPFSSSKSSSDS